MRRVNFHDIEDVSRLSRLLDQYLAALENSVLQVHLKALAWDLQIPETALNRLRQLHENPKNSPEIKVNDFRILFANVVFRFPTVKIWETDTGEIFIET